MNKMAEDIVRACMDKLSSLKSQVNRLRRLFAEAGGEVATHATSKKGLEGIAKSREISTPLRMVKNNPGIRFENPQKGYTRTTAEPAFMSALEKYEGLPPHLRGEARKGYFNYLDNKESPAIRKLQEIFGEDLPSVVGSPMEYEAALGKSSKYLKRRRFKEIMRKYDDKMDKIYPKATADPGSIQRELLTTANQQRNTPQMESQVRAGITPPDTVSFSDRVHLNSRFGNNTIIVPRKNLPIGESGPMSLGSDIMEYEHLGPYKLRSRDGILTEGKGNINLKGTGLKTISPKAWDIFSKEYLGG